MSVIRSRCGFILRIKSMIWIEFNPYPTITRNSEPVRGRAYRSRDTAKACGLPPRGLGVAYRSPFRYRSRLRPDSLPLLQASGRHAHRNPSSPAEPGSRRLLRPAAGLRFPVLNRLNQVRQKGYLKHIETDCYKGRGTSSFD